MKKLSKALLLAGLLGLSTQVFAEVENYKIDNAHSFANFEIRHVASKLSGTFSDVTGNVLIDRANLANSSVNAKISLLSVNTCPAFNISGMLWLTVVTPVPRSKTLFIMLGIEMPT